MERIMALTEIQVIEALAANEAEEIAFHKAQREQAYINMLEETQFNSYEAMQGENLDVLKAEAEFYHQEEIKENLDAMEARGGPEYFFPSTDLPF
jgi:hypothetical protein